MIEKNFLIWYFSSDYLFRVARKLYINVLKVIPYYELI